MTHSELTNFNSVLAVYELKPIPNSDAKAWIVLFSSTAHLVVNAANVTDNRITIRLSPSN